MAVNCIFYYSTSSISSEQATYSTFSSSCLSLIFCSLVLWAPATKSTHSDSTANVSVRCECIFREILSVYIVKRFWATASKQKVKHRFQFCVSHFHRHCACNFVKIKWARCSNRMCKFGEHKRELDRNSFQCDAFCNRLSNLETHIWKLSRGAHIVYRTSIQMCMLSSFVYICNSVIWTEKREKKIRTMGAVKSGDEIYQATQ